MDSWPVVVATALAGGILGMFLGGFLGNASCDEPSASLGFECLNYVLVGSLVGLVIGVVAGIFVGVLAIRQGREPGD